MKVLIGLKIQREKVYTKFPNNEEVIRCISSNFRNHKTFSDSYGSKDELIRDASQWLSDNFGPLVLDVVLDQACIFEPEKEGYYIVAQNSGDDLEGIGFFFVCDENQLTEMESKAISRGDEL